MFSIAFHADDCLFLEAGCITWFHIPEPNNGLTCHIIINIFPDPLTYQCVPQLTGASTQNFPILIVIEVMDIYTHFDGKFDFIT
jgi:hypothetical protein